MLNINRSPNNRTLFTAGILVCAGFVGVAEAGGMDMTPIQSMYNEALGAGAVEFEYDSIDNAAFNQALNIGQVSDFVDINNDGILDIIFGYQIFDTNIQFALGAINSDGTNSFTRYVPPFVPPFFLNYDSMTVADLDGNGWPELIIVRYDQSTVELSWLDSTGIVDTTTESFSALGYAEGASEPFLDARVTVRGADLDGDLKSDLVFNTSDGEVVVRWSSRGEGMEYEAYSTPMVGGRNALYGIEDYDGDGYFDVLLLDSDTEDFVILEGDGTDSLGAARSISVPMGGFVESVAYPSFGHFDGEPALDLVLYDAVSDQTMILANFADGGVTPVLLSLGTGERVECVPGDVDGSGFDDLLVTGVDALSNGPVIIEEKSIVFDPLDAGSSRLVIETGNTNDNGIEFASDGPRMPACVALNMNGDDLPDLIWLSDVIYNKTENQVSDPHRGHSIRVSPQRDGGSDLPVFGASQFEGGQRAFHVLPVDTDSDGVDELFAVGVGRAKLIDVNDGTLSNVPGLNEGFMSVAADLGGDGLLSLVVTDILDGMSMKPVNLDGSFGPVVRVSNPDGIAYQGIVTLDADLDGKDDLVAIAGGAMHVYRGVGQASVEFAGAIALSEEMRALIPGVGDLNGDGYEDLVIATSDSMRVLVNQQDGSFDEGAEFAQTLGDPYWMLLRDMDGDGNLDIVTASTGVSSFNSGICVFYLDSLGAIEDRVYLFDGGALAVNEVIAGDFDGDGLLDLVGSIAAGGDNILQVWVQTGDRKFRVHAVLPASGSSTVAMCDLNLDGAMDVITASDFDDSVRVHWGSAPAGCEADLNGDGVLDFFDISAFLSGEPDFNGDGGFDFFDISAFLTTYAAGCA